VSVSVRYIGAEDPGPVRIGERAIRPGEIISWPQDLVEELAERIDFELVPGSLAQHEAPALIEED
jgi:hypothetical protein